MTCKVEIDVYVVERVNKVSNEIVEDFYCGTDFESAKMKKDEWDLLLCNNTFTRIEIYSEEIDE